MTASNATAAEVLEQFKWEPQPEAEVWLQSITAQFFRSCPPAAAFANRLTIEAGVRFVDLISEIEIATDAEAEAARSAGWRGGNGDLLVNNSGIFPVVTISNRTQLGVGTKVECVADFLAANGITAEIIGDPGAAYRWAVIYEKEGVEWYVIERHGGVARNFAADSSDVVQQLRMLESFRTRQREFLNEQDGFAVTLQLVSDAVARLGQDHACDLFFAAERDFWQRRNRAAQIQKARQDRLGIGWANHDHHTYRSSRKHFSRLVAIWEKLGFHCRERFYAGKEAGWGAQVMEQPNAGIVTFNDVDLSPDELLIDFAHEPLPERQQLGTVGLWCGLHGESFLEAGMHHLECMFDFAALRDQLEREGVGVMKPFTDFPYLKQAFTKGERWLVREERVAALLRKGQITEEQAAKFRSEGAIGSHLENLERNQGFKGFNQTGVSEIIAATDPRKQELHPKHVQPEGT